MVLNLLENGHALQTQVEGPIELRQLAVHLSQVRHQPGFRLSVPRRSGRVEANPEDVMPVFPRRAERVASREGIRKLPRGRVETMPGGLMNGRYEAGPLCFEPGDTVLQPGDDGFLASGRLLG